MTDSREILRQQFIKTHGWGDATVSFLAGDCSNRHYYRLKKSDGTTVVLMDAYGEDEKIEPFIKITRLLNSLACSSPKVLNYDFGERFILLEDLGDATFTYCLKQGMDPFPLYETAVDALIHIHQTFDVSMCTELPTYAAEEMLKKSSLFLEWYYPYIYGEAAPASAKEEWDDAWHQAFKILGNAPKTIILRDFHVDNLLWLPERTGYQRCGLLDFQDAAVGPQSYDLVSLFEDVRQDVPADLTKKLLKKYLAHFSYLDPEAFMAQYYTLGAQRITRIMGVFCRMLIQNKRDQYMTFLPRAWKWLENDLKHDNLSDTRHWFETYFPIGKRPTK
jgi:aminoglycoside/choline kinase family phosphotransferase